MAKSNPKKKKYLNLHKEKKVPKFLKIFVEKGEILQEKKDTGPDGTREWPLGGPGQVVGGCKLGLTNGHRLT